jgi:hypothetical protein
MYKLFNFYDGTKIIIKMDENESFIPCDPANTDYQAYLAWLDEGNTPEPADPVE